MGRRLTARGRRLTAGGRRLIAGWWRLAAWGRRLAAWGFQAAVLGLYLGGHAAVLAGDQRGDELLGPVLPPVEALQQQLHGVEVPIVLPLRLDLLLKYSTHTQTQ